MKKRRRLLFAALLLLTAAAVLLALLLGLAEVLSSAERPYSRLEAGLYVGSAVDRPPPGTRAVVNVCGREDPYEVDAYLWLPVFERGSKDPDLAWLEEAVGFIAEQRQQGRTVYIHCQAGMNRSGAVATAYLMHEHGWDVARALAFARSKRSQIQPNPQLMRLLREYERTR